MYHSPLPALAIIWLCLAFLSAISGAFWAGRRVERGANFAAFVALQQAEGTLWATLDSTQALQHRWERLVTQVPRNGPRLPRGGAIAPAAETPPPHP